MITCPHTEIDVIEAGDQPFCVCKKCDARYYNGQWYTASEWMAKINGFEQGVS